MYQHSLLVEYLKINVCCNYLLHSSSYFFRFFCPYFDFVVSTIGNYDEILWDRNVRRLIQVIDDYSLDLAGFRDAVCESLCRAYVAAPGTIQIQYLYPVVTRIGHVEKIPVRVESQAFRTRQLRLSQTLFAHLPQFFSLAFAIEHEDAVLPFVWSTVF